MMLADLEILARTIYGEARGESYCGKKAVAHVILNRVNATTGQFRKDDTIATACLRHVQFSVWNKKDPNFNFIQEISLSNRNFRSCFKAALEAMDESDITKGSKHYHTKAISPVWAVGKTPVFTEGNHLFYNNID